MNDLVIETSGLTKRYGRLTAVDNLNLAIEKGEIYGLLGPNGSGKTTTILMLLGLTEPTEGRVRVLGLDPARQPLSVKAHVGYLPDSVGFYDNLTARENLIYIAKLNGLKRAEAYRRIDAALERIGLKDVAEKPVGEFSRGMRQRLGVAELIIKEPQIIIMDEPTLGLDPEATRSFLALIRELKGDGITFLLSSHLLQQVQSVCDRVGLFRNGRIVLEGAVSELARQVLGEAYRIFVEVEQPGAEVAAALRELPYVTNVQLDGRTYIVEATDDYRADTATAVMQAGGRLIALNIEQASLDDIYSAYFKEMEEI
ncbi:MAG TPA: ABC transporter ATP-binding protein [Anaerolineae bacterium]|nr:ABC transporter ATP-binding protein [Anaerolineae bacterium]